MTTKRFLLCALAVAASAAAVRAAELPGAFVKAELMFVGRITSFRIEAQGMSEPPVNACVVTFGEVETLRGAKPENLSLRYSFRGHGAPVKEGEKVLAAAARGLGDPKLVTVLAMTEATEVNVALARKLAALPIGWTYQDDKPVSPWAALGKKAWPEAVKADAKFTCSKTGRPALFAGAGITLKVEQVVPADVQKYVNPFGDGQFKVTVTNTGKSETEVPALLAEGGEVRWADSLVVITPDEAARLLPGTGRLRAPKPVRLKPGEGVSGLIDVLPLDGVSWPRGGSRVYFAFALGELTAQNFFYYSSSHHDEVRAKAMEQLHAK